MKVLMFGCEKLENYKSSVKSSIAEQENIIKNIYPRVYALKKVQRI